MAVKNHAKMDCTYQTSVAHVGELNLVDVRACVSLHVGSDTCIS